MVDIEKIRALLDHSDEELRIKGLEHLRGVESEGALEILIARLGDESWRVRKSATELLVQSASLSVILPGLVNCLRSEDNAGMRNAAVEVLERIGTAAADQLLPYLKDEDHDLRKLVIDILGSVGDHRYTPYLILALSDPDENVKSAAAENLGRIGDDEAVRSLLDVLKSRDLLLQFSALEALCRIGNPMPAGLLIPHLKNPLLKKAALEAMGKSKDAEALPHLIDGVGDRSRSTREASIIALASLVETLGSVEEAIAAIVARKRDISGAALSCLESSQERVRRAALRLLGWSRAAEFIPEILGLSVDEELYALVAEVVVSFGREGERYLVEAYPRSSDETKPFICYCLGEIGAARALPLLIDALGSPVGHVRHSAATALGRIGEKEGLLPLVPLLEDDYPDVQSAAVHALASLARADRTTLLAVVRDGLNSDSRICRRNASRILAAAVRDSSDTELALAALRDEDADVRRNAVEALAAIGCESSVGHLILALSDEDRDVRMAAVGHLGRMKAPEAFSPLLTLLKDDDIWVRSAAMRSIAEIGGADVAPAVAALLDDPVGLTVITALEILGRLALPAYAPVMTEKLGSTDEEVVKTAVESLTFWDGQDYRRSLRSLLDHSSWEVRAAVVRSLAMSEDDEARDLLMRRLEAEENRIVADLIRETLGQPSTPR